MLLSIISESQLIIRKRPIQYETCSLMTDTTDRQPKCCATARRSGASPRSAAFRRSSLQHAALDFWGSFEPVLALPLDAAVTAHREACRLTDRRTVIWRHNHCKSANLLRNVYVAEPSAWEQFRSPSSSYNIVEARSQHTRQKPKITDIAIFSPFFKPSEIDR